MCWEVYWRVGDRAKGITYSELYSKAMGNLGNILIKGVI